jgi:hypothetical protein
MPGLLGEEPPPGDGWEETRVYLRTVKGVLRALFAMMAVGHGCPRFLSLNAGKHFRTLFLILTNPHTKMPSRLYPKQPLFQEMDDRGTLICSAHANGNQS